jgi:hypothetical protein
MSGIRRTATVIGLTAGVTADVTAAAGLPASGYLAYQPTVSVITLTGSGRTAETSRSRVLTC